MASEDVVGKIRGDTTVNTIVNLAEEAKITREGVKCPCHQVLTVYKSLFAGGVAVLIVYKALFTDGVAGGL